MRATHSHNNTQQHTTTHNSTMSLSAGDVYRVRYDTNTTSSTQKKGERRIEVLQGPHTDVHFHRGEVVTVKDLSDPKHPGKTKTMYTFRFISIAPDSAISNRYDQPQAGARTLQWDSDEEDGLAVGDLVTVNRRETTSGETLGKIVSLREQTARIKPPGSRHTVRVHRRLLSRTSLASINRKSKRMAGSSRRRRGVGTIV
jgi:hypothetical protein